MTDNQPMTAEQAETLKQLAEAAYELDAFKPNLTRAEADLRIATLTAKLKLLDGPPPAIGKGQEKILRRENGPVEPYSLSLVVAESRSSIGEGSR